MNEELLRGEKITRELVGEEIPVVLVKDIDVSIRRGEFVSIIGPSGSGKSSLLYLLGLLDTPTSGAIYLHGSRVDGQDEEDLCAIRLKNIGFVFQFHFLLPEFNALENVMIPMERLGELKAPARRDRAMHLLEQLSLSKESHKLPSQLSGGQRQRVAIARALANNPLLLLADEPTGNLDTTNSELVFQIFSQLAHEGNQSVIAVTHDTGLAAKTDRSLKVVDGSLVPSGHD